MGELWRELGGYREMVEAGVDMVVAEANIRYRAPLRFDDEVEARALVSRLGETSMTTGIELVRDGDTVVEGTLRHVFIETGGGPTAPIPEPIRSGLAPYVSQPALG
jgi:acyl-CoA thioester hydrolase